MTYPCPKCGKSCEQAGDFTVEGVTLPFFQCDSCIVPWEVDGQTFPTAFGFCVNAAGECVDPLKIGDPESN